LHFARTSSLVRMARTARSFASSFNRAAWKTGPRTALSALPY
jgi:hypothetical protein